MTKNYSVSDEVEAWCTKCKLELAHTIVAVVDNLPKKVKCNTCSGQHNYKLKPAEKAKSTTKRAVRKSRSPEVQYNEHVERISGGDTSNAKKYTISGSFGVDDIIDHSKFGTGVVLSIVKTNKVEVLFKEGSRLLIQNQ